MADEEDPAIAVEEHFETSRRFLEEWLAQLREVSGRLRKEVCSNAGVQLRMQHFAPCQVSHHLMIPATA
jgi:hypothetical protein